MKDEPFPLKTISSRVLLKHHKVGETRGGVVLPDSAPIDASNTPTGTVLAVGPDVKWVKVGDVVLVADAGKVFFCRYNRHEFIMLDESLIVAVVDNEAGAATVSKRGG